MPEPSCITLPIGIYGTVLDMTTAAIYLRVSLDATGEQLAVTRQREDCLKIADDREWTVIHEYVDNSISASDAKKLRPEYEQMCRDYELGKFDALICWDLDRLTRQPRQLEDWIDRSEQRGLKLVTANGEADLTNDGGRMYARIKAAVARAEVERKGARQSRAQRQRAEQGRVPKGVCPLGYDKYGNLIPEEAKHVRWIFDQFASGDSLYGIARALDERGIPSRRGGTWSPSTIRGILLNARYAGRSVYEGTVVGLGQWEAIVDETQFDAVSARLSDPRRKTNGGDTARKYLGSGVYYCTCGLRIRASSGRGPGLHQYTCRNRCYGRGGNPIDELVLAVVRERLAQPDLADLLVQQTDKEQVEALTTERAELHHRLVTIEADYDEGLIDGRRYSAASEKVHSQLADLQRKQIGLLSADVPDSILDTEDPVAAFNRAALDVQRSTINALVRVTLLRQPQGHKGFRPESVTFEWV